MRRRADPVAHVQLGRGDSLVSPKSRFEREVQDAAGQQGSLHRVGRGAGLEHLFDIPHQAGEVSVGLAVFQPHQQRERLAFDIDRDGEVGDRAGHQERRGLQAIPIVDEKGGGRLHPLAQRPGLACLAAGQSLVE